MEERRYLCGTANETLEWMNAIANFLSPFKFLLDAHVVNFFKDRLWESLDKQWMDCLRQEPVENLLQIPSGFVQDYWPDSLKEFIVSSRSLALPREPQELRKVLPDLHVPSLGTVLAQGMNMKKKHEVEVLAAVINAIANGVGAQMIVDVGAGQGYLAQVLSFQYQLSVLAVDASPHHGSITNKRAERIKKHYAAKFRKSEADDKILKMPRAITCHILSSETLKALSASFSHPTKSLREVEKDAGGPFFGQLEVNRGIGLSHSTDQIIQSSFVLVGLHACGDLSVNMLRTFLDCEEFKALVSIGCCYNLLTEQSTENTTSKCCFPMSNGAIVSGMSLGKNARDLACQSAERWSRLTENTALQNFEVHAFRGALQLVLHKYHPEVVRTSPSIGRQGKAFRRQQFKRVLQQLYAIGDNANQCSQTRGSVAPMGSVEYGGFCKHSDETVLEDDDKSKSPVKYDQLDGQDICAKSGSEEAQCFERATDYLHFKEFSKSGLSRLGLPNEVDLLGVWDEVYPFMELVGPYWCLRAVLGPLVETLILLDRLLFLQEHDNRVTAAIYPLFDPALSPRNIAIIAQKI